MQIPPFCHSAILPSCHSAILPSCHPAISWSLMADAPKYRPLERFWPYAELPEQPTDAELAALDPDLYEALYGARPRPFSDCDAETRADLDDLVDDRHRHRERLRRGDLVEVRLNVVRGRLRAARRQPAGAQSGEDPSEPSAAG